ncbi:unnamed protein product [Caenorhabditis brenneri]
MDHRPCLFFSVTLGFLAPSAAALLEYFKKRIPEKISSMTPPKPKKPKAFKLLKLPWVALEEVLKPMENRDVFMLSLCSKNTSNILITFKLKANLYYIVRDYDLSVYSLQDNGHRDLIFSIECIYYIKHWVDNEQNIIRLTIGGMDVQCLWKGDGIKYYYTTNSEALEQALDNHIHQLFTAEYIVLEDSRFDHCYKKYPNLSKVTDLYIWYIRESHFKYIMEKYPNLKSFRTKGSIDEQMTDCSKLLNVDYVFIGRCYYSRPLYLRENFNGRFLDLSGARIHANDVLNFVKSWISGKKYFNLEVFFASNVDLKINFALISDELKILAKKWDRPTVYEYWSRATERNGREKIDLSGSEYKAFMDFERKTDQKMATLMLSDFKFAFIVWN